MSPFGRDAGSHWSRRGAD